MGGQVQVTFDPIASSMEYIRTGTLRALAVTSKRRLDVLPDIPTVGEFLRGFEATAWQGLYTPKNTPRAVIAKVNSEINASLGDQKIKTQLEALGLTVLSGSPGDFGKLIADDTEKWAKVIKFAGVKAD
jgi:tripartite-type tricarboxylate transporter receptor subunit TctC